jgi:2-polyprenyl-6-methoxyphenol hydroxylase-like FAD-dependent oxidoreductase
MEINMSALLKTNVLIVGAGPSGMTAALALAKFGISSMLIDRRQSNYMAPRAHALNPRTLEIFFSLGLDIEAFKAVATQWMRAAGCGGWTPSVVASMASCPTKECTPMKAYPLLGPY